MKKKASKNIKSTKEKGKQVRKLCGKKKRGRPKKGSLSDVIKAGRNRQRKLKIKVNKKSGEPKENKKTRK